MDIFGSGLRDLHRCEDWAEVVFILRGIVKHSELRRDIGERIL